MVAMQFVVCSSFPNRNRTSFHRIRPDLDMLCVSSQIFQPPNPSLRCFLRFPKMSFLVGCLTLTSPIRILFHPSPHDLFRHLTVSRIFRTKVSICLKEKLTMNTHLICALTQKKKPLRHDLCVTLFAKTVSQAYLCLCNERHHSLNVIKYQSTYASLKSKW